MKLFLKVAVMAISVSISAISFADDDDWQHQPPDGGSYSNYNNGESASEPEPSKSLLDSASETLNEVKQEYDNIAGNSAAEKAADTSGE